MEDTTKKVAMKFLLSNTLTGSLIGTGGKSIKELVEVTGARVNASNASDTYPGTSDRVILISGSKETVSLAQTLVWELLGLMADTPREKARSVEWSPRGTLGKLGTHDATEVTARFTIPAASGGLILGKGGDSIKNIAQETGVKIAMSTKEEALFTQERIITVTGRVSQCIACTDLIISKLAEQEEIPAFVNRGTTYSSPLTSTLGVKGSARAAAEETIGDATVASTTITINVPDEYIGNIFGKQVSRSSRNNYLTTYSN